MVSVSLRFSLTQCYNYMHNLYILEVYITEANIYDGWFHERDGGTVGLGQADSRSRIG